MTEGLYYNVRINKNFPYNYQFVNEVNSAVITPDTMMKQDMPKYYYEMDTNHDSTSNTGVATDDAAIKRAFENYPKRFNEMKFMLVDKDVFEKFHDNNFEGKVQNVRLDGTEEPPIEFKEYIKTVLKIDLVDIPAETEQHLRSCDGKMSIYQGMSLIGVYDMGTQFPDQLPSPSFIIDSAPASTTLNLTPNICTKSVTGTNTTTYDLTDFHLPGSNNYKHPSYKERSFLFFGDLQLADYYSSLLVNSSDTNPIGLKGIAEGVVDHNDNLDHQYINGITIRKNALNTFTDANSIGRPAFRQTLISYSVIAINIFWQYVLSCVKLYTDLSDLKNRDHEIADAIKMLRHWVFTEVDVKLIKPGKRYKPIFKGRFFKKITNDNSLITYISFWFLSNHENLAPITEHVINEMVDIPPAGPFPTYEMNVSQSKCAILINDICNAYGKTEIAESRSDGVGNGEDSIFNAIDTYFNTITNQLYKITISQLLKYTGDRAHQNSCRLSRLIFSHLPAFKNFTGCVNTKDRPLIVGCLMDGDGKINPDTSAEVMRCLGLPYTVSQLIAQGKKLVSFSVPPLKIDIFGVIGQKIEIIHQLCGGLSKLYDKSNADFFLELPDKHEEITKEFANSIYQNMAYVILFYLSFYSFKIESTDFIEEAGTAYVPPNNGFNNIAGERINGAALATILTEDGKSRKYRKDCLSLPLLMGYHRPNISGSPQCKPIPFTFTSDEDIGDILDHLTLSLKEYSNSCNLTYFSTSPSGVADPAAGVVAAAAAAGAVVTLVASIMMILYGGDVTVVKNAIDAELMTKPTTHFNSPITTGADIVAVGNFGLAADLAFDANPLKTTEDALTYYASLANHILRASISHDDAVAAAANATAAAATATAATAASATATAAASASDATAAVTAAAADAAVTAASATAAADAASAAASIALETASNSSYGLNPGIYNHGIYYGTLISAKDLLGRNINEIVSHFSIRLVSAAITAITAAIPASAAAIPFNPNLISDSYKSVINPATTASKLAFETGKSITIDVTVDSAIAAVNYIDLNFDINNVDIKSYVDGKIIGNPAIFAAYNAAISAALLEYYPLVKAAAPDARAAALVNSTVVTGDAAALAALDAAALAHLPAAARAAVLTLVDPNTCIFPRATTAATTAAYTALTAAIAAAVASPDAAAIAHLSAATRSAVLTKVSTNPAVANAVVDAVADVSLVANGAPMNPDATAAFNAALTDASTYANDVNTAAAASALDAADTTGHALRLFANIPKFIERIKWVVIVCAAVSESVNAYMRKLHKDQFESLLSIYKKIKEDNKVCETVEFKFMEHLKLFCVLGGNDPEPITLSPLNNDPPPMIDHYCKYVNLNVDLPSNDLINLAMLYKRVNSNSDRRYYKPMFCEKNTVVIDPTKRVLDAEEYYDNIFMTYQKREKKGLYVPLVHDTNHNYYKQNPSPGILLFNKSPFQIEKFDVPNNSGGIVSEYYMFPKLLLNKPNLKEYVTKNGSNAPNDLHVTDDSIESRHMANIFANMKQYMDDVLSIMNIEFAIAGFVDDRAKRLIHSDECKLVIYLSLLLFRHTSTVLQIKKMVAFFEKELYVKSADPSNRKYFEITTDSSLISSVHPIPDNEVVQVVGVFSIDPTGFNVFTKYKIYEIGGLYYLAKASLQESYFELKTSLQNFLSKTKLYFPHNDYNEIQVV